MYPWHPREWEEGPRIAQPCSSGTQRPLPAALSSEIFIDVQRPRPWLDVGGGAFGGCGVRARRIRRAIRRVKGMVDSVRSAPVAALERGSQRRFTSSGRQPFRGALRRRARYYFLQPPRTPGLNRGACEIPKDPPTDASSFLFFFFLFFFALVPFPTSCPSLFLRIHARLRTDFHSGCRDRTQSLVTEHSFFFFAATCSGV